MLPSRSIFSILLSCSGYLRISINFGSICSCSDQFIMHWSLSRIFSPLSTSPSKVYYLSQAVLIILSLYLFHCFMQFLDIFDHWTVYLFIGRNLLTSFLQIFVSFDVWEFGEDVHEVFWKEDLSFVIFTKMTYLREDWPLRKRGSLTKRRIF